MNSRKKWNVNSKTTVRNCETAIEVIVLAFAYFLVWRHAYEGENFPSYFGKGKYVLMGVYALLSWLLVKDLDGFQIGNLRRMDLAIAQWIGLFITNFISYFQLCLIANKMISVWPMVMLTVLEVFISTAFVWLYSAIYRHVYAPYKMIMVYGSENAVGMKIKMDRYREKYRVDRLISADTEFEYICREVEKYDAVVINDVPANIRNDLLKYCYQHEIRTYVVPKITDLIMRGAEPVNAFDTPMVVVRSAGLKGGQKFMKRAMDILLCLIAMIPALPIMLIVAIAIKLEDGGPVFYKQKRVTLGGKEFDILKFRSMIVDAEKAGLSIPATGKDPRITKVGNIIRACRVDELPQILNILKGDMSIVGPRPERIEHMEKYSVDIPEFAYRLKVKGGLTGYAQIYGKYNTSAYDKVRLDLMYIENYSLVLDIKLILLTIRIMLKKESTEGFEKVAENEQRSKELLQQIQEESTEHSEDVITK